MCCVPPSRLSEVLAVSPAIFIGIKQAECLQRERPPVDTDEVRVSEPEGALVYLSPTNLLAGVLRARACVFTFIWKGNGVGEGTRKKYFGTYICTCCLYTGKG